MEEGKREPRMGNHDINYPFVRCQELKNHVCDVTKDSFQPRQILVLKNPNHIHQTPFP